MEDQIWFYKQKGSFCIFLNCEGPKLPNIKSGIKGFYCQSFIHRVLFLPLSLIIYLEVPFLSFDETWRTNVDNSWNLEGQTCTFFNLFTKDQNCHLKNFEDFNGLFEFDFDHKLSWLRLLTLFHSRARFFFLSFLARFCPFLQYPSMHIQKHKFFGNKG